MKQHVIAPKVFITTQITNPTFTPKSAPPSKLKMKVPGMHQVYKLLTIIIHLEVLQVEA